MCALFRRAVLFGGRFIVCCIARRFGAFWRRVWHGCSALLSCQPARRIVCRCGGVHGWRVSCCMGSLAGVWSDPYYYYHFRICCRCSCLADPVQLGVLVCCLADPVQLSGRSIVGGILSACVYVFRWARFGAAVTLAALWAGFACWSVFMSSGRFRGLACLPGIWPGLRSLLTSAGGLAYMDRLINNYQTCLACHHFQIAACATISRKNSPKKESRSGNPKISRPAIFHRIFKTKKSGAPRARPHMMIIVLTCGRKFSVPEPQLDLTIMATP